MDWLTILVAVAAVAMVMVSLWLTRRRWEDCKMSKNALHMAFSFQGLHRDARHSHRPSFSHIRLRAARPSQAGHPVLPEEVQGVWLQDLWVLHGPYPNHCHYWPRIGQVRHDKKLRQLPSCYGCSCEYSRIKSGYKVVQLYFTPDIEVFNFRSQVRVDLSAISY